MDMNLRAETILRQFKGNDYLYGKDVLSKTGEVAAKAGKRAVLIASVFPDSEKYVEAIEKSLQDSGVELVLTEEGALPNAPKEDLARITEAISGADADVIISFGGGSTIDAVKAAIVLSVLGGSIDSYFGTGMVTKELERQGKELLPHVAIQTVSSSGAHLTKYSNITDLSTGQKKLIVDDAIIPQYPVFDYAVSYNLPDSVTMDGALDGIAHCIEVLYGAHGKEYYDRAGDVAEACIALVVENLPKAIADSNDLKARDALCLATDLGGYAIMIGGTNGGHLTSFSLIDILSHGRACAIMNPYYTVFFAPEIENGLKRIGSIYRNYGYSDKDFDKLSGRGLGIAVAEAMFAFSRAIGFPTTLAEVKGFSDAHIQRALKAAKDPQLKMKLQNMPVPLSAQMVDEYMGAILESAKTGDLSLIKNM